MLWKINLLTQKKTKYLSKFPVLSCPFLIAPNCIYVFATAERTDLHVSVVHVTTCRSWRFLSACCPPKYLSCSYRLYQFSCPFRLDLPSFCCPLSWCLENFFVRYSGISDSFAISGWFLCNQEKKSLTFPSPISFSSSQYCMYSSRTRLYSSLCCFKRLKDCRNSFESITHLCFS